MLRKRSEDEQGCPRGPKSPSFAYSFWSPVVQEATWSSQLLMSQEEAGEWPASVGMSGRPPTSEEPSCAFPPTGMSAYFLTFSSFPPSSPELFSIYEELAVASWSQCRQMACPNLSQQGSLLLELLCRFGGVCFWAAVTCLRLTYVLCFAALIAELHSLSLFYSSNNASLLVFGLLFTNSFVNYIKASVLQCAWCVSLFFYSLWEL